MSSPCISMVWAVEEVAVKAVKAVLVLIGVEVVVRGMRNEHLGRQSTASSISDDQHMHKMSMDARHQNRPKRNLRSFVRSLQCERDPASSSSRWSSSTTYARRTIVSSPCISMVWAIEVAAVQAVVLAAEEVVAVKAVVLAMGSREARAGARVT